MKVREIRLTNFKIFTDATITDIPDSARLVLLVGPNGCGKSSLIDAAHTWHRHHWAQSGNWDETYHHKQVPGVAGKNGIMSSAASPVYFESANCSGTAYAATNLVNTQSGISMVDFQSIQKVGEKYFVIDVKSANKAVSYKSLLNSSGCTATVGTVDTRMPLLEIPSASLPFPFSYPVRFEYSSVDINGDGKIGMDDAIKVLQTVSGMRD